MDNRNKYLVYTWPYAKEFLANNFKITLPKSYSNVKTKKITTRGASTPQP